MTDWENKKENTKTRKLSESIKQYTSHNFR